MIIWGSGGKSIDLGQTETRRCSTCEKDRTFKVFLNYRYAASKLNLPVAV